MWEHAGEPMPRKGEWRREGGNICIHTCIGAWISLRLIRLQKQVYSTAAGKQKKLPNKFRGTHVNVAASIIFSLACFHLVVWFCCCITVYWSCCDYYRHYWRHCYYNQHYGCCMHYCKFAVGVVVHISTNKWHRHIDRSVQRIFSSCSTFPLFRFVLILLLFYTWYLVVVVVVVVVFMPSIGHSAVFSMHGRANKGKLEQWQQQQTERSWQLQWQQRLHQQQQ